ncbi:type III secretion protein [Deltaproteobacteria bacterium Smac51]|nr:type III secretion protein [Deltaproteobacteria bacterium Smac51]
MPINLLDPNLGVQNIMEPQTDSARLPKARSLSSNVTTEAGLKELYQMPGFRDLLTGNLAPKVYDSDLLKPEVMMGNLASSLEELRAVKNPEVRRFVRDDLGPLMENTELLRTYTGLLIGG